MTQRQELVTAGVPPGKRTGFRSAVKVADSIVSVGKISKTPKAKVAAAMDPITKLASVGIKRKSQYWSR